MAEGTTGVEGRGSDVRVLDLAHEVDEVRARLDRALAELDRRRHKLTDLRRPVVLLGAAGLIAVFIGSITLAVRTSRERKKPLARARRARLAFSDVVRHRKRWAHEELPVGQKTLAAVGSAAAATLVRAGLGRLINGFLKRDRGALS